MLLTTESKSLSCQSVSKANVMACMLWTRTASVIGVVDVSQSCTPLLL